MREKQLSVNIERKVWDVNILAIYLVEDHPGNKYVAPVVERGLQGKYIPILLDILPIRAYWIMENKWGINKDEAASIIVDFLRKNDIIQLVPLYKETILMAFKLSKKFRHDVYDCIYLAFAKQVKASSIITTDTDFKKLCGRIGLIYENPVPLKILKKFKCYK